MRIVCFMREESMVKAKKIKLQKRSVPDARVHEGLSLPAGAGGSGHIGFKNTADLKEKYFVRTGRLARVPFVLRMLVLFFAQFIFTFVLYSRMAEGILLNQPLIAALFGLLLLAFTVPTFFSQLSLGIRRCHDTNRSAAYIALPLSCYYGAFFFPLLGLGEAGTFAQFAAFIAYAALAFMKGSVGANKYGNAD